MDLNSLIYFTEAAKDLNFTQTAKRLFISQQNLSNHIARLEDYYEVKLFERRPRIALTYSGEVLLAYANSLRMDEDNLKNVLADIKQKEKGLLHIGGSPSRSSIIMPILAERFAEKYPNVELHFHHHHSDILTQMLLDGELDFSIGVDKIRHPSLISTSLFTDSIYLMVADSLLKKHLGDQTETIIAASRNGACIRDFITVPFLNIRSSSIAADCFASEDCNPSFTITSNYPQFLLPNHYEKIAASIITRTTYLNIREQSNTDIHFFPIKTNEKFVLNAISFTRHKRKYLSQYGQHFLQITEAYFKELESL